MTDNELEPISEDDFYEYVYDQTIDYLPDEWDENYEDELENAIDDCGLDDDGNCHLAGTEHCGFFCPFNHHS